MGVIKSLMEFLVRTFFKVLFLFSGEKTNSKNLDKTVGLYKGEGFNEVFSKIRAWDAPYEPIDKIISKKAKVLDLGCGDGLLSNYLAISSKTRKINGVELNISRVKSAYKGLKNTSFKQGDILKVKIDNGNDVIILAHVLHHLPSKADQEKLLKKISESLKKGKDLVILEIDNKPLLKYIFTWITDVITVPILFEGRIFNPDIFYRNKLEWTALLRKLGFNTKIKSLHRGMPFSHILIHAKKI